MAATTGVKELSNHLIRPARWLTFVFGIFLSLLAIYSYLYTAQAVIRQPMLVLPDDSWTSAQLVSALAEMELPGTSYAVYTLGLGLVFSLTFLVCGWLILLRRSKDWFGMYLSLLLVGWANGVGVFSSMPASPWALTINQYLGWFLWPGLFLLLYLFPNGHIVPRWTRWLAWAWGLFSLYGLIASALDALPENFLIFLPLLFAVLLVGIYAQIYRYRRASAGERLQIKVVVVSLVLLAGSFILTAWAANFIGILDPNRTRLTNALVYQFVLTTIDNLAFMGVPISIAVAVLRYRLWDVDIVIRRTLVYGALTLTLVFVYFGSVILLQSLVAAVGGQQSAVVTVISTLLIAALFTPLHRRIQHDIDRRFYRKKYDAEKTVAAFSASLRNEVDLDEMRQRLISVVEETLQPEMISLTIFQEK